MREKQEISRKKAKLVIDNVFSIDNMQHEHTHTQKQQQKECCGGFNVSAGFEVWSLKWKIKIFLGFPCGCSMLTS